MKDADLDLVFSALAHPARRRMLDLLRSTPGMTIAALAEGFDMSAVGVLKHVRVLEASGLVHSCKEGRERRLSFNLMPIQRVYDRWTDDYGRFWAGRIADMKDRLESTASQSSRSRKAARRA
jgi:DNA-binding transcriptional ArsR family regulator